MKIKILLVLLFCVLSSSLLSCHQESSELSHSESKQLIESSLPLKSIFNIQDESKFGNLISFDNYIISIPYNTNKELSNNRTIKIYGSILVKDSVQDVQDSLTKRFSAIKLYSGDKCVVLSRSYTVDASQAENGMNLLFELRVDELYADEGELKISQVRLITKDNKEILLETPCFYITVYKETKNGVNIMDSPTAPYAKLNKDDATAVSYIFLTTNKNYKSDFQAKCIVPDSMLHSIEISGLKVAEDKNTQVDILDTLPPEQQKRLHVYSISITYKKLVDKHIIIEPLFRLNVTGEDQTIGPFCVLSLY